MNDIRRTILWVIFGFSLVMLWDKWQIHNGNKATFFPAPPAQTASAPAATATGAGTASVPAPSATPASPRRVISTFMASSLFGPASIDRPASQRSIKAA